MGGAENLKDLIAKYKVNNGTLQRSEDFGDCVIYDNWVKSLKFEEEEVQEILEKIRIFHEIGINRLVRKEIVAKLTKSGWKAKIIERKTKCGTLSSLIMEFGESDILNDGLCGPCLEIFLRDPDKFRRGSCDDEWDCWVLIVDL